MELQLHSKIHFLDTTDENYMLASGWNLNTPFETKKEASFNYILPLNKLLGFCEDYKKFIVNAKQELVLLISRNDLNCYVSDTDISAK